MVGGDVRIVRGQAVDLKAKMVEKPGEFDTMMRPERPDVDASEPLPDNPMEVGQPLADRHRTGKSPAFQFYPKDFLSDANVMAMSLTEIGAYWKLTCICWNEGSLPSDTKSLARLLGVPQNHCSKLWPAIAPCFTERSGRLIHPRLEGERKKQAEFRQRQSDNGRKGGRPSGKGLGTSGLTQPEAKESSPISNLLSASARKSTHTAAPIHSQKEHRGHYVCGRVCLPAFLHQEFAKRRGSVDELEKFYTAVLREWAPDGPRAADEPGEPLAFWRALYAERWPTALKATGTHGRIAPGDAWRPEGQ